MCVNLLTNKKERTCNEAIQHVHIHNEMKSTAMTKCGQEHRPVNRTYKMIIKPINKYHTRRIVQGNKLIIL